MKMSGIAEFVKGLEGGEGSTRAAAVSVLDDVFEFTAEGAREAVTEARASEYSALSVLTTAQVLETAGATDAGANALSSALAGARAALSGEVAGAAEVVVSLVAAPMVQPASTHLLTTYTSGLGLYGGLESDFNITIVFEGDDWTEALQQSFIDSAEYLSFLIRGDLSDRGGIDDVEISANLTPIDGSGGILGQAGPTGFRFTEGFLPTTGIMEFDTADAEDFDAQGLFDDIVLHEMMHVLGIGTLFDLQGDTTGSIAGGDLKYTGFNTRVAYNTTERDIARNDPTRFQGVPLETDGGPGTAGGHWDDELFEDELMTGFISATNYVSSMTVANLEDLGYDTIWDWRDPRADFLQPDEFVALYG